MADILKSLVTLLELYPSADFTQKYQVPLDGNVISYPYLDVSESAALVLHVAVEVSFSEL